MDPDGSEFVEVDPTGRYGRYNEILGRGASKIVYRAFDEYEGIEVAWNQIKLNDFLNSPDDLERLYSEIHLLRTLKHPNIMKFYASWINIPERNINFVTEMFTSGTLRELKHRRVNIRAVKHWCRQILEGLVYLHNHNPPVIHRDLKCENIFVNGNHGEVKIGDLGLAAILQKSYADRCVGTPEFMAPEVFAEAYNELVDIYAFGMCILEMVTSEYPYSECPSQAHIYCKVTSGEKPDVLYRVEDPAVRSFVEKCLAAIPHRCSAAELLNDPFLHIEDLQSESNIRDQESSLWQPYVNDSHYSSNDGFLNDYDHYEFDHYLYELQLSGIKLFEPNDDEASPNVDISIRGKKKDDGSIFLRLRTKTKEGQVRNIYFPFVIENDTALSVATEMVAELDLVDQDVTKIADMINEEISSLVPEWKPWTGFTETNGSVIYIPEDSASSLSSSGSFVEVASPSKVYMPEDASMQGHLEKIICQADKLICQVESVDITSLGSGRSLSVEECVKFDISIGNRKNHMMNGHGIPFLVKNAIENLPLCSGCTQITEERQSEILQRLRWVRALYHIELQKLRDQQLQIAVNSSPNHSNCSSLSNSTSSLSLARCQTKGEAMMQSSGNSLLHRTMSLPVDAVDL